MVDATSDRTTQTVSAARSMSVPRYSPSPAATTAASIRAKSMVGISIMRTTSDPASRRADQRCG